MANGSETGNGGGLGGLPPWVRAVAIVGIPGAIALFLVWTGANTTPKILSVVEANTVQINMLMTEQRKNQEVDAAMFRMMQRICSNTARSEDERSRCFDK